MSCCKEHCHRAPKMKGDSVARLHEALSAGGANGNKSRENPLPDGVLTVTPDVPEAADWRSRRSPMDIPCSSSSVLCDDEGKQVWIFIMSRIPAQIRREVATSLFALVSPRRCAAHGSVCWSSSGAFRKLACASDVARVRGSRVTEPQRSLQAPFSDPDADWPDHCEFVRGQSNLSLLNSLPIHIVPPDCA